MKKIMFCAAVFIYCLFVALSGNAQNKPNIPYAVKSSFNEHFKDVKEVRWTQLTTAYVACFSQGKEWRDAYFTDEGEFKGIGHFITIDLATSFVREKLSSYENYELLELYQYECNDMGPCFFAVLTNGKNKLTLKLDPGGMVTYTQKDKIKNKTGNTQDAVASKNQ